jgi:hypothetical protein
MQNPSLTEPGVKYFLRETLKKCHVKKEAWFNTIWNCGFFLLFIIILGSILAYRKREKLTPEDKKKKKEKDHAYMMTKIKTIQKENKKEQLNIITNLPKFESDFEIMHKKYYT